MKTNDPRKGCVRTTVSITGLARSCALVVALATGCYPGNDGNYLGTGATEDVAMFIKTVYVHPQPGTGPDLPTNQFDGRVFIFSPGRVVFDRSYYTATTTWGLGAIFSTTLTNESDPSDTGAMSGQVLDEGADGTGDVVNAQLTLADGARAVSLRRFDPTAFDTYKCMIGPGYCELALGTPTCMFEPQPGYRTFHVAASMEFKIGDGAASLVNHAPQLNFTSTNCSGAIGIPGTGIGSCGTPITTTISGDTEGTMTFDVASYAFPDDVTTVGFGLVGSLLTSPACAIPAG